MYPNFTAQPFQNPCTSGQVAANRLAQMPQMPSFNNPYATQFNRRQQGGLQFVNGRESVDVYPMAPNGKVLPMDSTMPRFYIRQTDAGGMATVTAYDFTAATDAPAEEYVTRREFGEWKAAHEPVVQQPAGKSTAKRPTSAKQDES